MTREREDMTREREDMTREGSQGVQTWPGHVDGKPLSKINCGGCGLIETCSCFVGLDLIWQWCRNRGYVLPTLVNLTTIAVAIIAVLNFVFHVNSPLFGTHNRPLWSYCCLLRCCPVLFVCCCCCYNQVVWEVGVVAVSSKVFVVVRCWCKE
jgi:hypothetical protein